MDEAVKLAEIEYGKTLSELQEEYHLLPSEIRPSWLEYSRPFFLLAEQKMKEHPLYQKPDPECYTCKGTGKIVTTDNPNGKFDWYVIGGKWNGCLTGNPIDLPYVHDVDNNVVPIQLAKEKALKENRIPRALLTPDGQWHERYSSENPFGDNYIWKETYMKILERYPHTKVVVVDCHEC